MSQEQVDEAVNGAQLYQPAADGKLKAFTITELLDLKVAQRKPVIKPVIRERDTVMVYSWRGVGKTMIGLQMGYSMATASKCLEWEVPTARKVLYIDGELPVQTLQERLAFFIVQQKEPPDSSYFRFLPADLQELGLPNLATLEGQKQLEEFTEPAEVIFYDSLSTLVRGAKENDAESWQIIQDYLLQLRRKGKTIILLHHEGKNGAQRGTSKREDILDTVIHLQRPSDYSPQQGARFEVHFEKCRALHGESVVPFEATLTIAAGKPAKWTITKNFNDQRVLELIGLGMSIRDIADEMHISKSAVHRIKNKAAANGAMQ